MLLLLDLHRIFNEKPFKFFRNFFNVFDKDESEPFAILFVVLVRLEVAAQHPARVARKWSWKLKNEIII